MNSSSFTIGELSERYFELRESAEKYRLSQSITSLYDADITYIQLSIQKLEAYKDLKRAENEDKFNYLYASVINHQIRTLRNRLHTLERIGDDHV